MPIHNLAVQKSFCAGSNIDASQFLTAENPELLIGAVEPGEEYYSLLYFDLEEVKPVHDKSHLLGAFLLLKIGINNITANTADYLVKPMLQPWEPGIAPSEIASSDYEAVSFIIPFHWTGLIIIDITAMANSWWNGNRPNHGLVMEGNKVVNNLLGFHDVNSPAYENAPQVLLSVENQE